MFEFKRTVLNATIHIKMLLFIHFITITYLFTRRNLRKPQNNVKTAVCINGLNFNPATSSITLKEKETKNITIAKTCGQRWMCNLTESPGGLLDPIDANFKINSLGAKQLKISVNEKKLDSAKGDPEKIQLSFKCKDRNNSIAFKTYSIDIEKEKVKIQLDLTGIKKLYKPLDKITVTPKVTPKPTESPLKIELSLTSEASTLIGSKQIITIPKNKTTAAKVSFDLSKIDLDNDKSLSLNAKLLSNKDYILNYTENKINIKLEKIAGSVIKWDKKSIDKLNDLSIGERKTLKFNMSKANPNGKTVFDIKFDPENKVKIVGSNDKITFSKNAKLAKVVIEVNDDNAKEKDKVSMTVTSEAPYVTMFKKSKVEYNIEIKPMKPLQIYFKLIGSDNRIINYGKEYRGVIKGSRKIYKDKDNIPKEGAKITIKTKNENFNKSIEIAPREVEIENKDYFLNSKFKFKIPRPTKFKSKIKREIFFILNIQPTIKDLKWPKKKNLIYKIEKIKKAKFDVDCPNTGEEKKEIECSIKVIKCKELDFNVDVKIDVKFDNMKISEKEVRFKMGNMCKKKHIKFKPRETGKIKLSFDVKGDNKKLFKEPDDKEIIIKGESKLNFTLHGFEDGEVNKRIFYDKIELTLEYGMERKEIYLKSNDEVKNKLKIKVNNTNDDIVIDKDEVEIMKGSQKSGKFKVKVKDCQKKTNDDCVAKETKISFSLEDSYIGYRTYQTDFPELKLIIPTKEERKQTKVNKNTKKEGKNLPVKKTRNKDEGIYNKKNTPYLISIGILVIGFYFALRQEPVQKITTYPNKTEPENNEGDTSFY